MCDAHFTVLSKVYIDHWRHAIAHETQYDRTETYQIRTHCSMHGNLICLVLRVQFNRKMHSTFKLETAGSINPIWTQHRIDMLHATCM